MIGRARWVVAFALRAVADVVEDLADLVDPQPWAGWPRTMAEGGTVPEWTPQPDTVAVLLPPSAEHDAPPFAADLVAERPPHLDP